MRYFLILFLSLFSVKSICQEFSLSDSLRGSLSSYRSCYDVYYYDLNVTIDDKNKELINSYNDFYITSLEDFDNIQIDLFSNLEINSIVFNETKLNFKRKFNAVFIDFSEIIKKGENVKFRVNYEGKPRKAVNPPWDGGFSWDYDKNKNPWIGVSCQGLGASSWWPCKDHQSDEPDSMRITCTVRSPLKVVSNGKLISNKSGYDLKLKSKVNTSSWFVSYPINNYNVTLCAADYAHFSDIYLSNSDTLFLDYYVLIYNETKAKEHFKQVKPMLECFEEYFGQYPFINDGFSLVETPYLGMEHQSAIAYGNNYLPGYNGNKNFIAGLDFDYIIVHETGHEWWGNSITTNDIADMWIHEGFCTYSEVIYVECMYGYDTMLEYVNNQKRFVRNDKPIVGPYNVNKKGSNDMYQKGSLMLHTLRNLINDDELWFSIIKGISIDFKYKVLDGKDIIEYINRKVDFNLSLFFNQYLFNSKIPILEYKIQKEGREYVLLYRWNAIKDFDMKLLINDGEKNIWISPNSEWKEYTIGNVDIKNFSIRDDLFYVDTKKID
ncbi:MAG: M1 family metallopeptidase [Flavobacteriales bacterium]